MTKPEPARRPHCNDCKEPFPAGDPRRAGLCPRCKRLNAVLHALHHAAEPCEADGAGRELRLALYRAVVEAGGCIFEGG